MPLDFNTPDSPYTNPAGRLDFGAPRTFRALDFNSPAADYYHPHIGLNFGRASDGPDIPQPQPPPGRINTVLVRHDAAEARVAGEVKIRWGKVSVRDLIAVVPWQAGVPRVRPLVLRWGSVQAKDRRDVRLPYRAAEFRHQSPLVLAWTSVQAKDLRDVRLPWNHSIAPRDAPTIAPWRTAVPHRRRPAALPWQAPPARTAAVRVPWNQATPRRHIEKSLAWGKGEPIPPPVIKSPWVNTDPDFLDDYPPILATKGVYIMSDSVIITRVSDAAVVECSRVNASLDFDSNAWHFTATLLREADLAIVEPLPGGPREIDIEINGWHLRAIVESYARDRAFNAPAWTIKGRSTSAWLAAPYAPTRSYTNPGLASMAQLALDELSGTGWTVNWNPSVDPIVDTGLFSYADQSPLQAIGLLANAIGARVQHDPVAKVIEITSRYPVSPGAWSGTVPDVVIPESIITRLGMQWQPAPAYNWILVSGGNQGVNVEAELSGTPGDEPAPAIVDPLIVDQDAGGERARVALVGSGGYRAVGITLPIISPISVVTPGMLAEIQESGGNWKGLVLATSITVELRNSALVARQQLNMERR